MAAIRALKCSLWKWLLISGLSIRVIQQTIQGYFYTELLKPYTYVPQGAQVGRYVTYPTTEVSEELII